MISKRIIYGIHFPYFALCSFLLSAMKTSLDKGIQGKEAKKVLPTLHKTPPNGTIGGVFVCGGKSLNPGRQGMRPKSRQGGICKHFCDYFFFEIHVDSFLQFQNRAFLVFHGRTSCSSCLIAIISIISIISRFPPGTQEKKGEKISPAKLQSNSARDLPCEIQQHLQIEAAGPVKFAQGDYNPSRSSSADKPYSFASAIRFEVDGSDMPFSHLLTACRLTPTASATNS